MAAEISWTKGKLSRFKKLYADTLAAGKTEFQFEGHVVFTGYAKYLIEFLQSKINQLP